MPSSQLISGIALCEPGRTQTGRGAEGLWDRSEGKVVMDVGASTGGFTDCVLQRGAKKVYAVDVGYGQLAWKLRNDPRVVNLERTNIRYLPTGGD